jgi:hypothetical protein
LLRPGTAVYEIDAEASGQPERGTPMLLEASLAPAAGLSSRVEQPAGQALVRRRAIGCEEQASG